MIDRGVSFFVSSEVKKLIVSGESLESGFVRFPDKCGELAHIAQAFLWCSANRMKCELIDRIPEEGVIICHRRSFPADFRPSKDQFVVYCKGDWDVHYYAQLHVVQNRLDMSSLSEEIWPKVFLPHFPQPGLVPRRSERGDRFETVAFVGDVDALSPELLSDGFARELEQLGLRWLVKEHGQWHDYRDIDAIVAVRDLLGRSTFDFKPPTKLFNSWLAGVPAVLGAESAYRAWKLSALDYLEATTYEEVIGALAALKGNPELRRAMQENALSRAPECSAQAVADAWRALITDVLPAYCQTWTSLSEASRIAFFRRRRIIELVSHSKRRLKECLGGEQVLYSYV